MLPVIIEELNDKENKALTRVVCVARYNGKFIYCKHKERDTFELPGGHIEEGESWEDALKREMYEETGAIDLEYKPVCLYKISTYGILCYVDVKKLDKLPNTEIERIELFDEEPKNLTYKEAHSLFFKTVKERLKIN